MLLLLTGLETPLELGEEVEEEAGRAELESEDVEADNEVEENVMLLLEVMSLPEQLEDAVLFTESVLRMSIAVLE